MDIQRLDVPSPRARAIRRLGASGALIVSIVFAVASLPVLFLYFAMPRDAREFGTATEAAPLRELPPAGDAAFVDVDVLGAHGIEPHRTVIVHDGRIARLGAAGMILPAGLRPDGGPGGCWCRG